MVVAVFLLACLLSSTGSMAAQDSLWVSEENLSKLIDPALLPEGAHVQISVNKSDTRINSTECPAALFANTQGNKVWGRTFLKVQCVGASKAPFFVTVDVKVWAPVLVMKQTVQAGQSISSNDVELRTMDLAQLQSGWITDQSHLNNKTAVRQLWPGTLLKYDQLKGQPLIRSGDTVKVTVKGAGFDIAGSAVAMETAEKGEVIKIKTNEGKVIHGVAIDALVVEVTL